MRLERVHKIHHLKNAWRYMLPSNGARLQQQKSSNSIPIDKLCVNQSESTSDQPIRQHSRAIFQTTTVRNQSHRTSNQPIGYHSRSTNRKTLETNQSHNTSDQPTRQHEWWTNQATPAINRTPCWFTPVEGDAGFAWALASRTDDAMADRGNKMGLTIDYGESGDN